MCCYANFSFVLGQNCRGEGTLSREDSSFRGLPSVEESQRLL